MIISTAFDKHFGKWFINYVLRAITKYAMIEEGESVSVALSGGKDSVVLLYILSYIRQYSNLNFDLSAIHIRTKDYDTKVLKQYCEVLDIDYSEEWLELEEKKTDKGICYLCARLKRGAISAALQKKGIRKVAYGHHADDAAETLFMNIVQNRKLGSFSPKVGFNNNQMILIRPMIYLEESLVRKIHGHLNLPLLEFICPHAGKNLRTVYKEGVSCMNGLLDTYGFSSKVVESLENVDLTNIWQNLH